MKANMLVVYLWLLAASSVQAQLDPLYNQYVFNQLLINPAYAGAFDQASVTFMSRAQWVGIDGAPVTNSLTMHSSIFNNKGGAGLSVLNDRLGVSNNTEVFASFSYKLDFGNSKLAMGLQGGLIQYKYNYADLNMEFINDPSFIPTDENFTRSNFGFGAMYYSQQYYFGFSIPRILNIEANDGVTQSTRYKQHYYLSGGMVFPLSDVLKIKPTTLIKLVDGNVSVDLNASILLNEMVWIGVLFRNLNTFGALAEFQVNDGLRIGYSFELPGTKLISNQFGTHELMVSFDFPLLRKQLVTRRYF